MRKIYLRISASEGAVCRKAVVGAYVDSAVVRLYERVNRAVRQLLYGAAEFAGSEVIVVETAERA